MDLFLNGQTAVVTGASRGIGPAVTRGLVAEGVRVPARAAPARPGGFSEITDEDWQASLTLNLMAAVRTTRAALCGAAPDQLLAVHVPPRLRRRTSVVNFSGRSSSGESLLAEVTVKRSPPCPRRTLLTRTGSSGPRRRSKW